MSHSRRQFLTTAGAIGAASAVPSLMTEALASTPGSSAASAAAAAREGGRVAKARQAGGVDVFVLALPHREGAD